MGAVAGGWGALSAVVVDHFFPAVKFEVAAIEVAAIEEERSELGTGPLHLDFALETLMSR